MMLMADRRAGREFAPAKINLALHVTGRRADGYHLLDSLVAFAGIGDVLHAVEARVTTLEITGPFAHRLSRADEENIILKALQALSRAVPGRIPALRLVLEKHLPVASGIGGGSADAAAALRLAQRMAGVSLPFDELSDLALSLGADVPVCLAGRSARMSGIGEALDFRVDVPVFPAVLVNPGRMSGTAAVFRRLALADGAAGAGLAPRAGAVGFAYLARCRNDLETPAITEVPEIEDVLTALTATRGVRIARMSGSGATCFGLYDSDAQAARAAAAISRAQPGWWVRRTGIGTVPDPQWARAMQKSTASSSADL